MPYQVAYTILAYGAVDLLGGQWLGSLDAVESEDKSLGESLSKNRDCLDEEVSVKAAICDIE